MISWALCFESNFCIIIILYDTLFFLFFSQKRGAGKEGVSQISTVRYDILNLYRRIFLL